MTKMRLAVFSVLAPSMNWAAAAESSRPVRAGASLPRDTAAATKAYMDRLPPEIVAITNTLIRAQEIETNRFGLSLSREPHGEPEVDLKLTEYHKPNPGPIEEFLFFRRPSMRFRVHDAMPWRDAMGPT